MSTDFNQSTQVELTTNQIILMLAMIDAAKMEDCKFIEEAEDEDERKSVEEHLEMLRSARDAFGSALDNIAKTWKVTE